MSNDKVAATFSGDARTDPVTRLAIEAEEKRGYACGLADGRYHQRPTTEDWAAARRWSASYGFATQVRETTGEHTKAKLADYTYGQAAQEGHAFRLSQAAQHTGSSIPGVPYDYETAEERYANAYMRTLGPSRKSVRRGWSPTHWELAGAAAIMLAIIGVAVYLLLTF